MKETGKRVLFLGVIALVGLVFTLAYLSVIGNLDQNYNDIIVEYVSTYQCNKAPERTLFFILSVGGAAIYALFYFVAERRKETTEEKLSKSEPNTEVLWILLALFCVPLFFEGNVNWMILIALILAVVIYFANRDAIVSSLCVYFLSIYSYFALYRVYAFCGGKANADEKYAIAVSLVVSIVALAVKKKAIYRVGLIEAILIPFLLLVFLVDEYKYGHEYIKIKAPIAIGVLILILIISFVTISTIALVKKWRTVESVESVINVGTSISIMAFNRFDGFGTIMSTDLHHPFENIIGYSQIFEMGKIPYDNYIPTSGLYSVIQGAIFEWFGDGGTFANYNVTNNVFYLLVIIAICIILKQHVSGSWLLLISLAFYCLSYNRIVFILPIMLLLSCKRLIDKKNTWLMTWFMTSLFYGLYYPLYGASTCLGFLPLAIWQAVTYYKSGELKKDSKKIVFWIGWFCCFGMAVLSSNLLYGTYKHMRAMSGQSILADGIARYGQIIPEWFMGYIGEQNKWIRMVAYYGLTFVVPALVVWVAVAVSLMISKSSIENIHVKIRDMEKFCISISLVIMPLICYIFTTIRLDSGQIYARSTGCLIAESVMFVVIAQRYIHNRRVKLAIIIFSLVVPASVNAVGVYAIGETYVNHADIFEIGESGIRYQSSYSVPAEYLYVDSSPIEKVGEGFIDKSVFDNLENYRDVYSVKDANRSYIGNPDTFGLYYLLGLKGDGPIEFDTAKGYSAAQETIDIMRRQGSIVAGPIMKPFNYYYIYYWLLTSGEYYFDLQSNEFIPNEGKYALDEVLNMNRLYNGTNVDLWNVPNSWGMSMESLADIFEEINVDYEVYGNENGCWVLMKDELYGNDADFIYFELSGDVLDYCYSEYGTNGKVIVDTHNAMERMLLKKIYRPLRELVLVWEDDFGEEHCIKMDMGKGQLLVPLGMGNRWLLNSHNSIWIVGMKGEEYDLCPVVTDIKFLKLRELE